METTKYFLLKEQIEVREGHHNLEHKQGKKLLTRIVIGYFPRNYYICRIRFKRLII
ncbi:hypothetical protein HMPREF3034_00082 [Prevotella sp. DNF00663]|nr:hypothetical protein HMPREF3034_00082 [Prevotella sp. DNF00663]